MDPDDSIVYERGGITIIVTADKATFKKNGLSIDIPTWVMDDFAQEFEAAKVNLFRRSEP